MPTFIVHLGSTFVVVTKLFRMEDARDMQNAYFHLEPQCIQKKKAFRADKNLSVPETTKQAMTSVEFDLLKQSANLHKFEI